MSANYTFREILGLTKFLRLMLYVGAGLGAVAMVSGFMQAELLSRDTFSEAEGQANDTREQIIGIVQGALYLFTVIVFGCWIVRANKNARALGAGGLRITPGWAVGYFFIPIVNLWRPYQAMKDLWRASRNPTAWTSIEPSSVLATWWTLWLLSNFLGQIVFRMSMRAKGLEDYQAVTWIGIVDQAVDIALCLVAAALVAQIAKSQQSHEQSGG